MDEKQFAEMFELLRRKTRDFTKVGEELLKENPQFLLIFRCVLNQLSGEFCKNIGKSTSTLWWFESGKGTFKICATEWSKKLTKLLKEKEINPDKSLAFWKGFKLRRARGFDGDMEKHEPVSKISEMDLKRWFDEISAKTNNFTNIEPTILFTNPQNILIFRLLLGFNVRDFAKIIERNVWTLRRWENRIKKMQLQTSIEVTDIIKQMLQRENQTPSFNSVLNQFRISNCECFNFDLIPLMRNGLNLSKKSEITDSEKTICDLLKKNNTEFEIHSIVPSMKKEFNVDFCIPNNQKPKIIIETFSIKNRARNRANLRSRTICVDHRFQSLKLRHPQIKTVLFIFFKGKPVVEDFMQKSLELELLNTDFLLLNSRIDKLIEIVNSN